MSIPILFAKAGFSEMSQSEGLGLFLSYYSRLFLLPSLFFPAQGGGTWLILLAIAQLVLVAIITITGYRFLRRRGARPLIQVGLSFVIYVVACSVTNQIGYYLSAA